MKRAKLLGAVLVALLASSLLFPQTATAREATRTGQIDELVSAPVPTFEDSSNITAGVTLESMSARALAETDAEIRTEDDSYIFTSGGPLTAELWASTDALDADTFSWGHADVSPIEVAEDGSGSFTTFLVTEPDGAVQKVKAESYADLEFRVTDSELAIAVDAGGSGENTAPAVDVTLLNLSTGVTESIELVGSDTHQFDAMAVGDLYRLSFSADLDYNAANGDPYVDQSSYSWVNWEFVDACGPVPLSWPFTPGGILVFESVWLC